MKNGAFCSERLCAIPHFARNSLRISKIVCGSCHTLVITNFGKVYSWGCNDDGALGRITTKEIPENQPRLVDLPVPIDKISAGDSHSLFSNSVNGLVYMCGVYRNVLKGNMTE